MSRRFGPSPGPLFLAALPGSNLNQIRVILDFLKKRRGQYFSKRGYKLVGIETELEVPLKHKTLSFHQRHENKSC